MNLGGLSFGLMDVKIDAMMAAIEDVGGLSYSVPFDSDEALFRAVRTAAIQARNDPRMLVDDKPDQIYRFEDAIVATNLATRSTLWPFAISTFRYVDLDGLFVPLALLLKIVNPIVLAADREDTSSSYCVFTEELRLATEAHPGVAASRVAVTSTNVSSGRLQD